MRFSKQSGNMRVQDRLRNNCAGRVAGREVDAKPHYPAWNMVRPFAVVLALVYMSVAAQAQIGDSNLEFSIDNESAEGAPMGGGTGPAVNLGTTLTGGVGVNGVTGNDGKTTVDCYANGASIFSWSTTVNAQTTFKWTPSSIGSYTLDCVGTWEGEHANGQLTTSNIVVPVQYTPVFGYINPKYIVLGVYYVVPGATSFSEYCDMTTVGTTDSITDTFTSSYQKSESVDLSVQFTGWLKGSRTSTSSETYTESSTSSNSVTVSQSSSLCNKPGGPTNNYVPNNHDYDIILVWTNPVVLLTFEENPSGTIEAIEWNGYGFNQLDQAAMEVDWIYVGCLNGDLSTANGTSCANNLAPLQRTWDTDETWPSGEGPALTSQDLADILAADPFGKCTPDANIPPSSYPADNCTNITPEPSRFTITDNEDINYQQPIPGGGQNTTIYTIGYSVADTQSTGYTVTSSEMYGVEQEWSGSAFGIGLSVTAGSSQTYTSSTQTNHSLTTTNQTTMEASVTDPPCTVVNGVCDPLYPSTAAPGPTEFDLYEDTFYGTFLYYPATWYY
jgi:hypothetical protein